MSREVGGAGEAGTFTARGVFYSMLACAEYMWGTRDLSNKCVLVQGLGNVGSYLVELLSEIGVKVKLSDLEPERVRECLKLKNTEFVPANSVYREECDIYSPCATGGTLNVATIPQLKCRIVVGAANNQLGSPEDARRLRDKNILYAPDYVANAGAAIALPALERMEWVPKQVWDRIRGISEKLLEIFEQAERDGVTTTDVAERMARARLAK
jgi:glutamate dehydrogenase/leucine dehydrogenase